MQYFRVSSEQVHVEGGSGSLSVRRGVREREGELWRMSDALSVAASRVYSSQRAL